MMNNKANIFEELNKMKSLIHSKSGVVISEQDGPIETIRKNLASISISDANEQAVVDTIINNYKTKEAFEDFLYRYKQNTGDDFDKKVGGTISPSDKQQWDSLVNHLSKMGITLKWDSAYGQAFIEGATPKLLPSTGTPLLQFDPSKGFVQNAPNLFAALTPRQKNITSIYCSVRNGIITNQGSQFKNTKWSDYSLTYKPTEAEITEAKKICPSGVTLGNNLSGTGQSVNNRFSKSVETLGIQGGKMDLQTLQTILKSLEGGESTAAAATTQGTPDLAQLTSLLNQL
jgi:hypothetical protein